MPMDTTLIKGALIADAAALGLHWLYDQARIAEVADRHGGAAFVPLDPANFEGVPAYFAHAARRDGQLSQYGETLRVAVQSLGADAAQHGANFAAHFGAGGSYRGYIDRPTRAALAAIASEQSPSGSDDDQLPALSSLPALLAAGASDAQIAEAVSVTHTGQLAHDAVGVVVGLLRSLQSGASMGETLAKAASSAPAPFAESLAAALATPETSSIAYGQTTGIACQLTMALPLSIHILKHSDSFVGAIETNIRAGGDSCGRAMLIGAAAAQAWGCDALPFSWGIAHTQIAEVVSNARA